MCEISHVVRDIMEAIMRIKYIKSKDPRVNEFNSLIEKTFPNLLSEKKPDIYLVGGGDGAMLHAIHKTIDSGIPYIGKALGTFNFLMNNINDDKQTIQDLIDDKIELDFFKTFAIHAQLNGKKLGEAVNDVILGEKLTGYHTFKISTKDNDFENFTIKGSGICISTPIGSTAFNFNNNGRILPLDSDLLSITGVVCNRYLNDILPVQEVRIQSNGARIYLTNVASKILDDGDELLLRKGSDISIGFINKEEFLLKRRSIANRYRA